MRIEFEEWLAGRKLQQETLDLFQESFSCFRVRAYRGALLFSYLAFLHYAKAKLIRATRPVEAVERVWDKSQKELRDPLKWEEAAYRALTQTQPFSFFVHNADFRQQIEYWRDRRNDAAHGREYPIGAAHVEMFWSFARTALPRLVINGGKEGLVDRLRKHYDPRFTRPGLPVTPIVEAIPESLRPTDYQEFIGESLELLRDRDEDFWMLNDELLEFLDAVFLVQDSRLHEALMDGLVADSELLLRVCLSQPSIACQLGDRPETVRRLWYELLPFSSVGDYPDKTSAALAVVVKLIRSGIIPSEERDECVRHVIFALDEGEPRRGWGAPMEDFDAIGFTDWLREEVFERRDVGWLANNLYFALDYAEEKGVDAAFAGTFAGLFPVRLSRDADLDEIMSKSRLVIPEDFVNLGAALQRQPEIYQAICSLLGSDADGLRSAYEGFRLFEHSAPLTSTRVD